MGVGASQYQRGGYHRRRYGARENHLDNCFLSWITHFRILPALNCGMPRYRSEVVAVGNPQMAPSLSGNYIP